MRPFLFVYIPQFFLLSIKKRSSKLIHLTMTYVIFFVLLFSLLTSPGALMKFYSNHLSTNLELC